MDVIELTDIGRREVTSFTSDSINDKMVAYDTQIYQGAMSASGEHRQLTINQSASGGDSKREEQNLLYGQTASSTAIRHPTVRTRTLSGDRPVMCSLDSLDEIPPSGKCHNRCLTILLMAAGLLATVSVIVAVVAYIGVLGDECTCLTTVSNGSHSTSMTAKVQSLRQNIAQMNMSNNNLSVTLNNLLTNLSNLNDSVNTIRGPQGEIGPRGKSGSNGVNGSSGEQGVNGTSGDKGLDGPMGMNGSDAMLNFSVSSEDLFQGCIRTTNNCTPTGDFCDIGISIFAGLQNPVVLERACVIRSDIISSTENGRAIILPSLGDNEVCTCRGSFNECILYRLECTSTQININVIT